MDGVAHGALIAQIQLPHGGMIALTTVGDGASLLSVSRMGAAGEPLGTWVFTWVDLGAFAKGLFVALLNRADSIPVLPLDGVAQGYEEDKRTITTEDSVSVNAVLRALHEAIPKSDRSLLLGLVRPAMAQLWRTKQIPWGAGIRLLATRGKSPEAMECLLREVKERLLEGKTTGRLQGVRFVATLMPTTERERALAKSVDLLLALVHHLFPDRTLLDPYGPDAKKRRRAFFAGLKTRKLSDEDELDLTQELLVVAGLGPEDARNMLRFREQREKRKARKGSPEDLDSLEPGGSREE